jgi:glycerophosphoryl diester phosphodiesterase
LGSDALLVAHRGASAYTPEHTIAAYELAIEQGADFIEPDLQITKDGRLIALHDVTLERTTNVRDIFPERFRESGEGDSLTRRWYAYDFTLAEIKQLDAGSWFGPEFRGARVPSFEEVIEVARGRAGIYPETKASDVYSGEGFEMERLLVSELEGHGLARTGADPSTPVVIQSFSPESLRILREELGSDLSLTFLLGGGNAEEWTSTEGLERIAEFASGIGPAKNLLLDDPGIVPRAHAVGLTVVPWTFGSSDDAGGPALREEMVHFLCVLAVDGLFTNNPDLFPRGEPCDSFP